LLDDLDIGVFRTGNVILAALPASELLRLLHRLEPVNLRRRQILLRAQAPIDAVHFVEAGMVSLVSRLERGGAIEVGSIGREGVVGLPLAFGATSLPEDAVVLAAGRALRMSARAFLDTLHRDSVLFGLLLRHQHAFRMQIAQAVACNGRHHVDQRLARWLLVATDRLDSAELSLTREEIATMLGVRRAGVACTLAAWQRAGVLRLTRHNILILNRHELERISCECYDAFRRANAMLGSVPRERAVGQTTALRPDACEVPDEA
jgi:CRP-like cAMP-binding protein